MRGHVRRRGTKWCVVVDVGRDADGRRKQKWHSGFATRKDADAALAGVVAEINDGGYIEPSKLSTGEYLTDRWLPAIEGTVRPSTFHSYAMNVRTHVLPRVGSIPLQRLSAADLNRTYADLARDGRKDGKSLSPRTIRYVHTILRKALKDAERWDLVSRNAADRVNPPAPAKIKANARKARKVWTADELSAFLHHVSDDRLAGLWRLYAMTGARRGEALGLRWTDLDLEAREVTIARSLIAFGYAVSESDPKTDR